MPKAGGGRKASGHNVHGGGFAGSVGAEQTVDVTRLDGEAQIVHRGVVTVDFCKVFCLDQRVSLLVGQFFSKEIINQYQYIIQIKCVK